DFYGDSGNSLDQLVGHWKFERIDDETNTTDDESVKQNHATVYGATYTTGKTAELGNALRLDGTDDYAGVAYDTSLTFGAPATAMTMSAWIRTTGTGFQPVLSKARDVNTANIDYRFGLDDHGKLELHRWNQSSSGGREAVLDSDGAALNDGEWHHIAFVNESASSHKLYVDGQLAETSTAPWQYNDSNTQEVNIGRYKNASAFTYYFAGDIDEVRIVRSALQAGEIQDLYDGKEIVPPPALQNIVIEGLSFEATNLNHADEIGIRQGQISVTAAKNITIRNNEFARGGGSGVYVDASDSITIEGNDVFDMGMAGILVSRSGKASTDSKVTNNRVNNTGQAFADWGGNIALKASDHMEVSYNQLSTSARHGVTLRSSNDNTIKFNEISDMNRNSQDTGAIYYGQSEGIAVENNRVHHSGKFGRGQTGIYVEDNSNNSTLRNNIVYSILASETNNLNTSVIAKGEKTAFYNNIFDYSTSYAAIRSLAFNGYTVNLHKFEHNIFASFGSQRRHFNFVNYSNDRVDQSDDNLFYKQASGSHQMIGIPGDDTLANWKTLRGQRYDQHSLTGDPKFVDRANGDYTLQATSPALTALGFQQIDPRSIGLKSEFVYPGTKGQWVFGGDAADVSMSGRDGATHGGAAYATDRFGKTTSGLSLDGATGYVGIDHDSALTFGDPAKPFTVSAWINTSASGVQAVVAKSRTNSGSSPIDYQFGLDAAGYLQLSRWNADPEDAERIANDSLPLNDGKWHHIAFVNESASSHKLYADGQLLESSTTSWTHDFSSTEPVEIGRYANAGAADLYFAGQIDDVSILQRAMSEREIKELNHIPLAPLVP
ncbi:MAG: right-handed parallel beta-helix repeat-containing protein, partial [Paenibacillaceae bacterium]|nr:right-handed parallel beta-helix repeat-containing protein [Paenibacillaceae bacterium]